jgi:hypothetical protein
MALLASSEGNPEKEKQPKKKKKENKRLLEGGKKNHVRNLCCVVLPPVIPTSWTVEKVDDHVRVSVTRGGCRVGGRVRTSVS